MAIDIVYALLLLGHVLGDFYFQSITLVEKKKKECRYLLLHSSIYTVCIGSILCLTVQLSWDLMWLVLFSGLLHFVIDSLKRDIKRKPFILDQLLHLITLGVAWVIWGGNLQIHGFVLWSFAFLPSKSVVTIILGLLWLLKPVGLLISEGEIWDFSKSGPGEHEKGVGKMIGYLERIIVFLLLLNGQYPAIGFVITAKSIIRFPEINRNAKRSNEECPPETSENADECRENSRAEYYLIGTLLSLISAFAVYFLLT